MEQARTARSDRNPAGRVTPRISANKRKQSERTEKQRQQTVSELMRQMIGEQLEQVA